MYEFETNDRDDAESFRSDIDKYDYDENFHRDARKIRGFLKKIEQFNFTEENYLNPATCGVVIVILRELSKLNDRSNFISASKSRVDLSKICKSNSKFRVMKSLNFESMERARKKKCLLFMPDTVLVYIWDFILAVITLYVSILFPIFIAFWKGYNTFKMVNEIIISIIFFLDIIFNFNKAYYDKKYRLIIDRKRVVLNYLCGWFVIDVISFFPYNLFFESQNPFNFSLKILKISKLFHLIRLIRIFKLVVFFNLKKTETKFKERFLMIKSSGESFTVQMMFCIIVVHIWTCLLYFIPVTYSPGNNWVVNRGFEDKSDLQKYLFSLHWTIETIITVGYGETPVA